MSTSYEMRDFLLATGMHEKILRGWIETEIMVPSLHRSEHSGDRHLWSEDDVEVARLLWRLHAAGVNNVRLKAVGAWFREKPWMMHAGDVLIFHDHEMVVGLYSDLLTIFDGYEGSGTALVARLR